MTRLLLVLVFAAALILPVATSARGEQVVPNGIARVGGPVYGAADVDVAVLDTGVDPFHADLNVVGGYDCTDNYDFATFPFEDGNGHGTHVAGTIGALDNEFGVVGVNPGARIWAIKVLRNFGGGSIEQIVCGLNWVRDHANVIEVVNMSLGADLGMSLSSYCPGPDGLPDPRTLVEGYEVPEDQPIHEAVCEVVAAGVTVVVAAGNGGGDAMTTMPASYPEVITVSSFADFDGQSGGLAAADAPCSVQGLLTVGGFDDQFFDEYNAAFPGAGSYHGYPVDIAAPGVCVLSSWPGGMDGTYGMLVGTSMATPHVAGAVSAYFGLINPDATPAEAKAWLVAAGEPQPENFNDVDEYAEPLLDVRGLVLEDA